jgi:hypothetical protein
MLHDCVPISAWGAPQDWFFARDRFGIGADGVRFQPYFSNDGAVTSDTRDVKVSWWTRPGGRALLCVVGFQRSGNPVKTTLKLDAGKLGLPPVARWYVYDAERLATYAYLDDAGRPVNVYPHVREALDLAPDGTLTLPVRRHDYRLIIVQDKALPTFDPEKN